MCGRVLGIELERPHRGLSSRFLCFWNRYISDHGANRPGVRKACPRFCIFRFDAYGFLELLDSLPLAFLGPLVEEMSSEQERHGRARVDRLGFSELPLLLRRKLYADLACDGLSDLTLKLQNVGHGAFVSLCPDRRV